MEERLLRLPQIIGDKKKGITPIVPVSKSTWWAGVKSGKYPAGRKLSPKITVWLNSEVQAVVDNFVEESQKAA